MSSITTLKKNSRFKSACPSSGPVITSVRQVPATSTCAAPAVSHAASCTNLVQESIVALHRLVPHPVLPPSVRDPGHAHARSRRVHARSFRCTNLCNFLSASVGIFAAAVRLYSAAPLWVSWHQTLSWASSASGSFPAVPLGQ